MQVVELKNKQIILIIRAIENSNSAEQTDFNNTLQGESFDDKNG